jgi:glycosyltransferase involved in cell wall biosynthesis
LHIAVIVPTYDEAENLPKMVSALFALPLDLEVLIVDDASPDGSGQIADDLSASHPGRMSVMDRKAGACHSLSPGFPDSTKDQCGCHCPYGLRFLARSGRADRDGKMHGDL